MNASRQPAANVEVVCARDRLSRFQDAWRRLPQAAATPLLDYDWISCAAATLHADNTLQVVLVRDGDDLAAAAPLVGARAKVAPLRLIGVDALHEPAGFLYRDEQALRELIAAILSLGRPIVLQRMEADSVATRLFRTLASSRGKVVVIASSAAPFVPIASDWSTYVAALSSRRRYDYRRNRKRLESQGDLQTTHHVVTPEIATELFVRFVTVEAAGWKSASGSALRSKAQLRAFFEAAALRWATLGSLRISFLRLGIQDVAAVLWLVHGNRAWVLKIGFDERWSEASPGIQLLWDVLQSTFDLKLGSFEFLGSDESWLSIWTTSKRQYETVIFYPYTVSGLLAVGADALTFVGRRVRGARLP